MNISVTHRLILIALLQIFVLPFSTVWGQQGSLTEQQKRQRAEGAADLFIQRFRETLDFGAAFDEMGASNAVQRLRKTGEIKSIGLTESLAKEVSDETALRLYKAFMNYVYLSGTHASSIKVGFMDSEHAPLPKEIKKVIRNSKHLSYIYSDSVEGFPVISNKVELNKFIVSLEAMSKLFRKYLPRNVFGSLAYRENIKKLERERGHQYDVDRGDSYYEIGEDTEVYGVCRDTFCFTFIEEDGRLKVLGLTLGN